MRFKENRIIATALLLLSATTLTSTVLLIKLPIRIKYLVNLFTDISSGMMLLIAYTIVMLPFVIIGFLVTYFFSVRSRESGKLYFFDLFGAGLGAAIFFCLINWTEVFRSLLLLSALAFFLSLLFFMPRKRKFIAVTMLLACLAIVTLVHEVRNYSIDKAKGWEWIPGFFKKDQYESTFSQWHPLGRTDAYRIKDIEAQKTLYRDAAGTFEINVEPRPEFSYFTTNFLAGTPVYNLSVDALKQQNSQVKLFSQSMEVPYVILDKPKVVVIGAGGWPRHLHGQNPRSKKDHRCRNQPRHPRTDVFGRRAIRLLRKNLYCRKRGNL